MKLKSIKKLCSAVRYHIKLYDENGRFIESFMIDYVDMTANELSAVIANHYFKYENCKVRNIDTRIRDDGSSWLEIGVNI